MSKEKSNRWLEGWQPEEGNWDPALAHKTGMITTFNLGLAFCTWFLASALAPKLQGLGFQFSKSELYWLTAIPGLAGGIFRLLWMFLPPILGTRKLITMTMVLLLFPLVGWGMAIQNPNTSYKHFLLLAFLSGIGGGAFSGFMPSTSYFFPKRMQGTTLGLQAGLGNFGVSFVQFLTPWIVGFSLVGVMGPARKFTNPATGLTSDTWYQNAAYVYVPFVIIGAVLAWTVLKSVPVTANFKKQIDIFNNIDTLWMTLLYVMTFGIFSGLSAQFGLLIKNIFGAGNGDIVKVVDGTNQLLVQGYTIPDVTKYAFIGPLVGAAARIIFAPLTDRFGGARWTLVSGVGLFGSIVFTMQHVNPDVSQGATYLSSEFHSFLYGMIAIFLFSGIGNASTFKQMPMIFEPRKAGGVIGWVSAIAAFGPFIFGVALASLTPHTFLTGLSAFIIICIVITWMRYARPGAPMKS
jgi:NNP family nitrate/nitrite transporter-like MFS transporter